MTRLLVATTNANKLREIRELLAGEPVEVVGLDALPRIDEPEEAGETFEANARLKALHYDRRAEALRHRQDDQESGASLENWEVHDAWRSPSGLRETLQGCDMTVAEDSGLIVDALDGEPGVRSARFVGAEVSYRERFAEIYRRIDARPGAPLTARFVSAIAVAQGGRILYEARGVVEGEITRPPRGTAGFGYDPIFYYPPYGCTLAEVTQTSKLDVAHRGQSFRQLAGWLRTR